MGQTVYAGLLSGAIAGLVSGIMLQLMWVLTPLSLLLSRPPNPATGWIPIIVSMIFGLIFALAAGAAPTAERVRDRKFLRECWRG